MATPSDPGSTRGGRVGIRFLTDDKRAQEVWNTPPGLFCRLSFPAHGKLLRMKVGVSVQLAPWLKTLAVNRPPPSTRPVTNSFMPVPPSVKVSSPLPNWIQTFHVWLSVVGAKVRLSLPLPLVQVSRPPGALVTVTVL